MNDKSSARMKIVYAITERGERSFWTRIGVAYTNRDGSINLKLEVSCLDGLLSAALG